MRRLPVQLLLTAVHSLISGPSREFGRVHGQWGDGEGQHLWHPGHQTQQVLTRVLSGSFATLMARVSSFCRHRPPRLPPGASEGTVALAIYGGVSGGSLASVTAQVCSGGRLGAYPWGEGRGEGSQKFPEPGEGGRHDALLLCTRWGSPRTPYGLAPPSLPPAQGRGCRGECAG